MKIETLKVVAIELLKGLIKIPSFSREEQETASLIEATLQKHGVTTQRFSNNIFAVNTCFDSEKPSILLCSHHDTVRPNSGYTLDPFDPKEVDGKIFGLGSNDAGGALVSLLATFLFFYAKKELPYNICFAAVAEEEVSGKEGIERLLKALKKDYYFGKNELDVAIIGEPTQMNMAIAEKGLLVLDVEVKGKAGHAAREEGENAIYKAIEVVTWIKNLKFDKVSTLLGPVKATVTAIQTKNKAHNVVPDRCSFIVDVRTNEWYTNEEVVALFEQNNNAVFTPRSLRLQSSFISPSHPIVEAGRTLNKETYGSPTLSDMALLNFPAVKMGPGDSARSHTADEFIYVKEMEEAIEDYIAMIQLFMNKKYNKNENLAKK